jgi:DNA-binding transcriptional ArsR family regulator
VFTGSVERRTIELHLARLLATGQVAVHDDGNWERRA